MSLISNRPALTSFILFNKFNNKFLLQPQAQALKRGHLNLVNCAIYERLVKKNWVILITRKLFNWSIFM
jgi:hypothetical protein